MIMSHKSKKEVMNVIYYFVVKVFAYCPMPESFFAFK